MKKSMATIFLIGSLCLLAFACQASSAQYTWAKVTNKAAYPQGYNYPVFVFGNWMVTMNNGAWLSTNGERWVKTDLPDSGLNSAYQKYVQFNGAIFALGTMRGNYENLHLTTKIARTRDFGTWETIAESSNLPKRVFYGAVVFGGKIWLAGGYDGERYYNDVWNSADGVRWNRVAEKTAWSPRLTRSLIVFKNRLWIFGGGVIDGEKENNPNSNKEVWSSTDGVNWTQVKMKTERGGGGTPVVFDNKLWFVGANRNDGIFGNAVSVSDDGITWQAQSAPWSPRGAVAVWVFDDKLYMTGGKFSETVNGEIKFIYSNDVWAMSRTSK